MMKKTNMMLGCVLAIFLLIPAAASANWSVSLGDDGVTPITRDNLTATDIIFTKIVFTGATGGMTWTTNPVTGFSLSGWTASQENGTVTATGPAVSGTLFWTLNFTGTRPSGVTYLDYLVYDNTGNAPDYGIRLTLNNGQINYTENVGWRGLTATELQSYSPSTVPIPPTALLLGAGIFGLAALRKKRGEE